MSMERLNSILDTTEETWKLAYLENFQPLSLEMLPVFHSSPFLKL